MSLSDRKKSLSLASFLFVAIYSTLSSLAHAAGYDADNASAAAYTNGWGTNAPEWSLDGTVFVQGNNSGFGGWSLLAGPAADVRIESVASLGGGTSLNSNGKSFRLSGPQGGYSHATRYLDPSGLSVGQTLSFQIAVNYRNGAKGVDLFDTNNQNIFNFNVGGDDYRVNNVPTGSGSVGNSYSYDSVFSFLFAQTNSTGGTWKVTRSGGFTSVTEGTYTGVIRKVDWYAGGTENNNPDALFFNNLLIGPSSRTINLAVDMNAKIAKNVFNPTNHGLELRGNFNDWGTGVTLSDPDKNGVYTASILWPGPTNSIVEFKMYATGTGTGGLTWENPAAISQYASTGNRSLSLGADGGTTNLPIYFGDDDGKGPVVSRAGPATVNLNVGDSYADQAATAVDDIEGSCIVTPSVSPFGSLSTITQVAGTYTITYNSWDAAGNQGTPAIRTVVVTANDGYDAFISGKTTNSQTLAEYAFGATDVGVLDSGNRPQVSVSGGNLVLTYNVRVTNPSLVVVPQLSTNLPSFAPDTSITTSTNGQTTNNGVVLEQRTASVPIDGPGRKFLRLQVQRGP